jgi:3-phenylpropionate/cinnamic acid dioxygenase small subunit
MVARDVDSLVSTLLDERAVTGVLNDYARALDTRDWALLASLFTRDAIVDYSAEGGPICVGPAAVVADCESDFHGLDATHHMVSNVGISILGDDAEAECYLQAWHHAAHARGGTTLILVGGYRDKLVRTPDGWKITRRQLHVAFAAGNPSVKVRGQPEPE